MEPEAPQAAVIHVRVPMVANQTGTGGKSPVLLVGRVHHGRMGRGQARRCLPAVGAAEGRVDDFSSFLFIKLLDNFGEAGDHTPDA